jgi:hypothetical protein
LEDLKEWLGYEDTPTAVAAIKGHKIPHFFPGRPDLTIEERGAARRVRFIPARLETWATENQKIHDKTPVPVAPTPEERTPVVAAGKSGWRSELGGRGKRAGR